MTELLLRDRRVLVVEDEYLIADAMTRNLRRAGATVLGPVSNVASALSLLATEDVDAAVLDINLGEQKVYPVVDALLRRGAHCVFATGNDPADVPSAYGAIARCEKPVDPSCLFDALTSDGDASTPVAPDRPPTAVSRLRERLVELVGEADAAGASLVAVKLCEAIDAVDAADAE